MRKFQFAFLNIIFFFGGRVGASDFVDLKIETHSGIIERIRFDGDERQFAVRLTRPNHQVVWLEEAPQKFSSPTRVSRVSLSTLAGAGLVGVYEVNERSVPKLLGIAPRIFDKECSALARIDRPTPLGSPELYMLSHLFCDENDAALTESLDWRVVGKDNQNWAHCQPSVESCQWLYRYPAETEAAAQVATYSFLWRAKGQLQLSGIHFQRKKIKALSMAFKSNRSIYNADNRSLSYGTGAYPDGLDGFVVVHEWWHSLIDDLNSGFYGYDAQVLHEALADYGAADLFEDSCFAPFDAQEIPGRKCVRDLDNFLRFPADMTGTDAHHDSLIFAAMLWDLRKILPPGVLLEMIVEALVRLPKNPSLLEFSQKLPLIYERLVHDRSLLPDRRQELKEILKSRGLELPF